MEPKAPASVLMRLGEILSKSFYGATAKSAKESFIDKVQTMGKDDALDYLDEFVDEYLISNCRLSISVTKR